MQAGRLHQCFSMDARHRPSPPSSRRDTHARIMYPGMRVENGQAGMIPFLALAGPLACFFLHASLRIDSRVNVLTTTPTILPAS